MLFSVEWVTWATVKWVDQRQVLSPACVLAVLQLHIGAKPYDSNHHPSASSPPREGNAGMQSTRPYHILVRSSPWWSQAQESRGSQKEHQHHSRGKATVSLRSLDLSWQAHKIAFFYTTALPHVKQTFNLQGSKLSSEMEDRGKDCYFILLYQLCWGKRSPNCCVCAGLGSVPAAEVTSSITATLTMAWHTKEHYHGSLLVYWEIGFSICLCWMWTHLQNE